MKEWELELMKSVTTMGKRLAMKGLISVLKDVERVNPTALPFLVKGAHNCISSVAKLQKMTIDCSKLLAVYKRQNLGV